METSYAKIPIQSFYNLMTLLNTIVEFLPSDRYNHELLFVMRESLHNIQEEVERASNVE